MTAKKKAFVVLHLHTCGLVESYWFDSASEAAQSAESANENDGCPEMGIARWGKEGCKVTAYCMTRDEYESLGR